MPGLFSENTSEVKRPLTSIPGIYLSRDSLEKSRILNSRELLVFILESIQDGVSILDVDMRIRYVNSSIKHWYSSKRAIVGRKVFRDIPQPQ
jgi:PAS domain-containing protein